MTKYSVEADNLVKRFGKTVAVNDVSFKVSRGEFFCIIGPSGCGKTTTLRLIAGLIRPDSGRIYINGQDVTSMPAYKRPIAMVFQTWALFPHMTVYENVEFGLKMHKVSENERRELVKWVLDLVKMSELANRKPRELSGGQQQRVAIARALVVRPEILLLDEPLGNLDFKLQLKLQEELKQIHRSTGITFLYVTHDQRQAMAMATKIMVMNNGIIEQIGDPITLYTRPENVFVAKFVGESNLVEGVVRAIEGGVAKVETPIGFFDVQADKASVGSRAWVFWRPETTVLGDSANRADVWLEGEIMSVTPVGTVTNYEVDVKGYKIKAVVTGPPIRGLDVGSKARVGCFFKDLRLLTSVSSSGAVDVERVILGE